MGMEILIVLAIITLILVDMCCIVYLAKSFKHSVEGMVNKLLKELDKEEK